VPGDADETPDAADGNDAAEPVQPPDALTAGWFHDSKAWPHIIGWGALCALIATGAYLLSRRWRSFPRGWGAMVLPFLVTLYFLYQNINRLLPPGL
jgi:sortase A